MNWEDRFGKLPSVLLNDGCGNKQRAIPADVAEAFIRGILKEKEDEVKEQFTI